jgi:LAO/AO transport system kinase
MEQVALDDNVFIRSMATRGSLGGLAATTREIADVFDAFGFDRVIIETVGVGQSELDIAHTADTTVVVLVPESGDSIQTLKAGVMEAADIFVVNKSDRPGADRLRTDVGLMLGMRRAQAWTPPVLRAVAAKDEGIDELVKSLDRHFDYLEKSGALVERRRQRLVERVIDAVDRRMRNRLWRGGDGEANGWIRSRIPDLEAGVTTPYSVADELLAAHGHLVTRVDD